MDFCDAVFYLRSNFHFSQVQRRVSYRRVDLFFDYSDKLKKLCKQWDRLNPILSIRAGMCAPFVSDNEDFVDDRIFADVMPSTSKTTGDEEAVSGVSVSLVVLWLILTKLINLSDTKFDFFGQFVDCLCTRYILMFVIG